MQTGMTLRWCVLLLCAAAVTELVAGIPDVNFTSTVQRGSESDDAKVRSVLECVIAADWTCVQVKTVRALRLWLNIGTVEEVGDVQSEVESKQDGDEEEHEDHEDNEDEDESSEGSSEDSNETSDEDADEPAISNGGGKIPGSSLLEQLADALVDGVSAIFLTDSDDESRALALRGSRALDRALQQFSGRRKNKKGGGHGHGATELISVIMMLKSGLMAIGTGFSALIQIKSFGFTVLGLVMSAVRLFLQYKATTNPTPPPIIKIFQVHQTEHTETEVHHVTPELHDHGYIPHHTQSSDGLHHHHHLTADYAHDRAYVAQKPGGKKKQEQQPIILMPSRP